MQTVPVIVTAPLDGPFDYAVDGNRPAPGSFVTVPFGNREIVGVIWDYAVSARVDANKIKHVGALCEAPPMSATLRRMIDHACSETLSPRGSLVKLAIPVPAALESPQGKPGFRRLTDAEGPLSKPQARVLDLLRDGRTRPQSEITRAAKVPTSVLRQMAEAGLLAQVRIEDRLCVDPPDTSRTGPVLSSAQETAARTLSDAVGRGFGCFLLEGVPGSGKTEVYFEAVAHTLKAGKHVLVLLPEIALSAPWIERFAGRFGVRPVVWHSGLTAKQRLLTWRAIARGHVPLVVGARSALFLPQTDLGLIVIDEEHDSSFKQEEGAIYHARDLAEFRAGIEQCPIVLASATPAIETVARAASQGSGRPITHLTLPARFGGASMPSIKTVDLRKDRPARQCFLSGEVTQALKQAHARGEQSLVFLNRRGYAPLTLCRACGHRLQCPSCSAWLVSHRFRERLMCHHCGYGIGEPECCPNCGSVDSLVASGPGVERLADEIASILPAAKLALLTSDQPPSSEVPALLQSMTKGDVDILIGTQIIAKGHHFPNLSTVIVADADLGLAGGDLRAAERSFQLLYQVAGRAGRERLKGHVLIQTHLPEHPVIQALAAGDKARFYQIETDEREASQMPPYGRLAALILSGPDAAKVRDQARKVVRAAPDCKGLMVLGPAPAPLSLLRGRYRERILIKARLDVGLPEILRAWLKPIRFPAKVHLAIDVDPVSFL